MYYQYRQIFGIPFKWYYTILVLVLALMVILMVLGVLKLNMMVIAFVLAFVAVALDLLWGKSSWD